MAVSSEGTDTSSATGTGASQGRSRTRMPSLGVQVLIGLCLGVVIGLVTPAVGEHLKFLGDAFIRLIQMAIIPLVFPLIVLSIAKMESAKALGRLAGKTLLYFEVVTTPILVLTMVLATLAGLGKGANLTSSATGDTSNIQKSLDLGQMFLGIIPNNVFGAFSQQPAVGPFLCGFPRRRPVSYRS
jgi:proton glutamate symport protein